MTQIVRHDGVTNDETNASEGHKKKHSGDQVTKAVDACRIQLLAIVLSPTLKAYCLEAAMDY